MQNLPISKVAKEEVVMYNHNSVFNAEPIDFANEPLFLGSGRNVARLDLSIEQEVQKKTDRAVGQMWFKNDYSYKKDGEDYSAMHDLLQLLYLKNLKFQTLADSVAARSVLEVFLPITTNPQLEVWWIQHGFFEGVVHSPTYSEIVKALPVDAKKVFDDIIINDEITSRASDIIACFDNTAVHNAKLTLNYDYCRVAHMESVAMSLYALNILEAMLFKSSFLTTFSFNENGYMESSAKAVKKISIDEIQHTQMSSYLINRHKSDPEWAAAFSSVESKAIAMYDRAIQADYRWADYLFPAGESIPLLGINNEVVKQYIDFNTYNVLQSVGLPLPAIRVRNPATWADKYSKLSNVQVAMKETDSSNYLLGKLDTHISNEDWEMMP